jgi:UDP-N-acetylglucosamine 2-epimerase (non-hydrolysing)
LKLTIILGTRPEIIKMSPVIHELERRQTDYFILHSGQHYSYNMDKVFFEQLNLPQPKYNLDVGSGTHGLQTAKILDGVEAILLKDTPDVVLVEGDTNTVLAAALAAAKLQIKVGHIEAGLRSYDRQMPEEINRILTDHCSDYLFAPTKKARDILIIEGIPACKIHVTGNTIVDAVQQNLQLADKTDCLNKLNLIPKHYFLVTVHRQENVDNKERFASIMTALEQIAVKYAMPVLFPIHPRSKAKLAEYHLIPKNTTLIEPLDYLSFLKLESNALLVLTDSGGLQEECCILKVPCVTLRDNTERPETVEVGANMLAGVDRQKIMECAQTMLSKKHDWHNPFGDGKASEKILEVISKAAGL